jgi:hypothetical protein
MPTPIPLCTHIMPSGATCGSPAVSGTVLCYHHSAIKTALRKAANDGPIDFVFPEDRAAIQINYFLLLQAYTAGRIDLRAFNSMQRILRAMAANLGKSLRADDHATTTKPATAEKLPQAAIPETQTKKPAATANAPSEKSGENTRPRPVAQNTPQPKPSTTRTIDPFEEIAAKLKPLGAECFLNIPSLSNSLPGFSLTR